MSKTSFRPRLTRFAILAVTGAIALAIGACGTSNKQSTGKPATSANPTRPAPSSVPAPAEGKDHVEGMIRSVSGNTIQLTQRDRTAATVDFTSSTEVIESTPAQLTDVTVGSCVDVSPAAQGAPAPNAITARSVTVSPAVGGRCPPQPGGSQHAEDISGTVASVSGNTITVTGAATAGTSTQTSVTVTTTTGYTKQTPTTTQAITQGKCMAAQGTTDSGGVLQATTIDLEPCPPPGRPHYHFPRLPRHHRG